MMAIYIGLYRIKSLRANACRNWDEHQDEHGNWGSPRHAAIYTEYEIETVRLPENSRWERVGQIDMSNRGFQAGEDTRYQHGLPDGVDSVTIFFGPDGDIEAVEETQSNQQDE